MGTDVEAFVEARAGAECHAALRHVETEFQRLESLLSRFLPHSELSMLNRHGALQAGPELVEVVEAALDARSRTDGRFDPTVHNALVGAGYDRSFESVSPEGTVRDGRTSPPCGGWVMVDRERSMIVVEPGFRLDLGGIAKGYAVDRTCDRLSRTGPCLVNAGGDLAVRGDLDGDGPWPVAVDTPDGPVTLGLRSGALATSARDRRRWRRGDEERHHLIDPATGSPAETGLLRVTAVAGTAMEAEVQAKNLFLLGEDEAILEAAERGVPALLVTEDGRAVRAGGLR
jgi:thiamine biosynthesis lipoprotein